MATRVCSAGSRQSTRTKSWFSVRQVWTSLQEISRGNGVTMALWKTYEFGKGEAGASSAERTQAGAGGRVRQFNIVQHSFFADLVNDRILWQGRWRPEQSIAVLVVLAAAMGMNTYLTRY